MFNIDFPSELPVSQHREEIITALKKHQVVIVAGETGSGKTTQLPKIALTIGRERIAHTQPRRIAARAVAERIADELGSDLGSTVGYQVRFTDRVSKDTKIRLMTDGILLAQIHKDRDLKRYDTIIIDEAHERSLNIDFLIGYIKRLLPRRPDLKVIITSATIDPESFAQHFADETGTPAPVVEVSGRTYPVDIRYEPLEDEDMFSGIQRAVRSLEREGQGDILVFLSGESEIKDAAEALQGESFGKLEILPLYGRLSAAEQHRVFGKSAPGKRRVVLATNVAETSLTVPGIKYVIDAGFARVSRWSARSKVQRLPIEAISQASANQRAGRAGRLSPGIAIRLYSEDDFSSRPEFTEPEILRTGLAAVILQMMSLGLGDIMKFPFLTPPDKRGVSAGLQLLSELGAVRDKKITRVGRDISKLPIEPRFARMIIESFRHNALTPVTVIVAGLTIQDVRERPEEERARADQLHSRFNDPEGDLITLLNLWNYLSDKRAELSGSAFRRLCRSEFLNYMRVREWADLVRQLSHAADGISRSKTATNLDHKLGGSLAPAEAIHRSVLAGLLSHLGLRDDTQAMQLKSVAKQGSSRRRASQEYLGSRGTKFVLHPGSVLSKKPPEMIMSVELVETSRLFARGNAVVDPAWAEDIAGDLIKRHISEPHWQKSRGAAIAYERLTLFGIPIVERRAIQLSSVDAEHARELFIRHALVDGEWDSHHKFDRANWQLRRDLESLEARSRRRDLVANDDVIYDFYDARIPAGTVSQRDFEGWWKKASKQSPRLLHLRREDLLETETEATDEFPRVWSFGDQKLKLKYRFDPTAEDDGVSVMVPLPLLPRLENTDVSALVPGLRSELVEALIRSLPKNIRKHVVPAAEWAKKLIQEISPELNEQLAQENTKDAKGALHESLTTLLARAIQRATSQIVQPQDFDLTKIPNHLKPTFIVIDERGKKIASSRYVDDLKSQFKDQASKHVARVSVKQQFKNTLEKSGLTKWDFGDLPEYVDTKYDSRGGAGTVRAYPALLDKRTHVDLVLVSDRGIQSKTHMKGVERLLLLSAPNTSNYLKDYLSNEEKLLIAGGPFRSLDEALNEALLLTAQQVIGEGKLIWSQSHFESLADDYAKASIDSVYANIALVTEILRQAKLARNAIEKATSMATLHQVRDAKTQLDALLHPKFISGTGAKRLERLPVYINAINHRITELQNRVGKDRVWQNEIDETIKLFKTYGGSIPLSPDATSPLVRARWLIEEYRISLFAQHLGTKDKVSKKRIAQVLEES
ncbi:MAG TPA: ATP-dependent RNA helicase HrpA [Microbacteriaceae bacterium]|nr:ATP-dependent RNA helicase HrpA [Microbacteriaceae bacterium]